MKVVALCLYILVIAWVKVNSRPTTNEEYQKIEIDSILNAKEGNGTIYLHVLSDGTMLLRKTYSKVVNGYEVRVEEGSYSFIGPDKLLYKTTYIADERGYRAKTSFSNATATFVEDSIDPKVLISLLG
uniref:Putative larval cuticle protein n=1 Tax=Aedes albopictus TaxID=7160 RepID=A0A1W7R8X1_AEDAL